MATVSDHDPAIAPPAYESQAQTRHVPKPNRFRSDQGIFKSDGVFITGGPTQLYINDARQSYTLHHGDSAKAPLVATLHAKTPLSTALHLSNPITLLGGDDAATVTSEEPTARTFQTRLRFGIALQHCDFAVPNGLGPGSGRRLAWEITKGANRESKSRPGYVLRELPADGEEAIEGEAVAVFSPRSGVSADRGGLVWLGAVSDGEYLAALVCLWGFHKLVKKFGAAGSSNASSFGGAARMASDDCDGWYSWLDRGHKGLGAAC